MRLETKSAAILIATLALGVVLGMVGQGLLIRERTRRVEELRTPPGFVSLVEEVIQPRPEQEPAIRAILEESAGRYDSLVGSARMALGQVLDSMKLKLTPLLDDRQRERLSRMAQVPDPNRRPPRPGEPPREPGRPGREPPPEGGPPQPGDAPHDPGRPRRDPPPEGGPPRDRPPPPNHLGLVGRDLMHHGPSSTPAARR